MGGAAPAWRDLRLRDYLVEGCEICRGRSSRVTGGGLEEKLPPSREEPVTSPVLERLLSIETDLAKLREEGKADFDELMSLSGPARLLRVRRARRRFRNPFLVERLIDESRRVIPTDPFEAYALADLAHAVALRIPQDPLGPRWAMTCLARATAYRGNALRATGDFKEAEPQLEVAYSLFWSDGDGDPMTQAEILSLVASLRFDQRLFDAAEEILLQVLELYREIQDELGLARTLIKQARLYAEVGDPEAAIRTTRSAAALIDPEESPRLYLATQHNLTMWLEDCGRFEEAREVLLQHTRLYQSFPDPWTQLRYAWSCGTTARGLGQLDDAESSLQGVRAGFLEHGLDHDAALVGLDLALVYVLRGKTAELRRLAEEILPVFLAQNIHREAVMALMLFHAAARR